jgi:hypothetical protein
MASRLLLIALWPAMLSAQPLQLHPANPHYFEYHGKPILLVTSGEHYGAVLNRDFDYRRYLDTLAKDGLNLTRLFIGTYHEVPGTSFGIPRNTLAPRPEAFLAPWARAAGGKFDLDQWDPAYFDRLGAFVSEARNRGIIVEVTLFSAHYQEQHWKLSPLNPANNVNATDSIDWHNLHTLNNGNILGRQEAVVRQIVGKLSDFDNIYFEIQNEPWADRTLTVDVINRYLPVPQRDRFPNSIDFADVDSLAWQSRVSEWIHNTERFTRPSSTRLGPSSHLIAQNYANFRASLPAVDPNVSILNFHYAYPDAALWNRGWNRPVSYDESGFIGRSDDTYRREAWRFLMAGGAAFDGLDYSFSIGHEDGTDLDNNGPGGGSPTLRRQLGILRSFLESFDFVNMRPDPDFVRGAPGAICESLSNPGRQYVVYCETGAETEIQLALPEGHWRIELLDPRSGQRNEVKRVSIPRGDMAISVRPVSSK